MLNWADFHSKNDAPKMYKDMADKKMNEFQQVTDANYVYVEDVNGGQAKMTLKDFNSNLPRNLCWSGILNKGETVELKAEYKLIYVCETSKHGAQAMFSTGYGTIMKFSGYDMWTTDDTDERFCLLSTGDATFLLKNNYIDGCSFQVYIL